MQRTDAKYDPSNKTRGGSILKFKKPLNSKPAYLNLEQVSFDFEESLNQKIQEHLGTESVKLISNQQHELEFRLGDFTQTGSGHQFEPNLSRLKFNRIVKYLNQKYQDQQTESLQLDIIYDKNYRITIGKNDDLSSSRSQIEYFCKTNRLKSNTFFAEKVTVERNDNVDWNYRISSCSESEIKEAKEIENLQRAVEDKSVSKFFRYKYRYSFTPIPQIRIDCTVIKETPIGAESGTLVQSRTLAQREKYQVEIEYIQPNQQPNQQIQKENQKEKSNLFNPETIKNYVKPYLEQLVSLYMCTLQPISRSHSHIILDEYLKLAFNLEKISIDDMESKPASNKFIPMEVEALTRENYSEILEDYLCSQKADGEHYLLFAHESYGLYLINNRLEVSPLKFTQEQSKTQSKAKPENLFKGTYLFDCELTHEDGVKRLLLFDAFFHQSQDLRDYPLYEKQKDKFVLTDKTRFQYVKEFLKIMENVTFQTDGTFIMEEKQYYPITKASRFFNPNANGQLKLKEDEFPYMIDGIVYTPAKAPYPKAIYHSGSFKKPHSFTDDNIQPILKWKPMESLSIDFRVAFQNNANSKTTINGVQYQVVTLESAYNNLIYPFEPSAYRVKDYNKLYLPIINGQAQITEHPHALVEKASVGHIVREKDILECVWVSFDNQNKKQPTNSLGSNNPAKKLQFKSKAKNQAPLSSEGVIDQKKSPTDDWESDYWGRWVPIRYREDKTQNGFPNNFRKVADRTWIMIHDKQILPEHLVDPYNKESSPQLDMGYYQTKQSKSNQTGNNQNGNNQTGNNRESLKELRTIHNSLKSILIFLGIKQAGNENHRLLDLGSGQGGDLHKWRGLKYVLGLEMDESNLKLGPSSAFARYREYIDRAYLNNRPPQLQLDLIQGDIGRLFAENRVSDESIGNYLIRQRLLNNPAKFGVISCQFALHYLWDSEEHIDNFFRNANQFLADDGYLIATTFDGEKVLTALKSSEQQDKNGRYFIEAESKAKETNQNQWKISTPTKYHKLENFGQKIFVHNPTIKDEEEIEYLVNYKYLFQVAEKYGLFPSQLGYQRYNLPADGYGVGNFSELYTSEYLDMIGKTVILDNTPHFNELQSSFKQISRDDKRYSQFSSFIILKKSS